MKPVAIICCLLFSYSGIAQFPESLASDLQSILDNMVSQGNDNGLAACVILEDGSEWHGEAGVDGQGDMITDSTVFHGASSCKTHVTTCLMLLAQEGLVNLDAPWSDYIDLNVDFDPAITIRQLVNNTSGIADYLEIGGVGLTITEDMDYFWTPTEILEDVVSQTPDFTAGSDFHYSSSNFVLAGLIIEEITGNGLYDELRTRIWEPLGMNHTYGGAYDDYTEPRAGVWWSFLGGVENWSDEPETSMLSFAYGGAGVVSTATDQANFIHTLLSGNLVADTSLAQMHNFHPNSYDDWPAGYGMGIHHAINTGSDQVIGVDGYFTNMSSSFRSEDCGFSIATMTNTQSAWYGIFAPIYAEVKAYLATQVDADQIQNNQLVAYPQPAQDLVYFSGFESQSLVGQIAILDLSGRIVKPVQNNWANGIDVGNLPNGMYIAQFTYTTGHKLNCKFQVRR